MTPPFTEDCPIEHCALAVVWYRGRELEIRYLAYSGPDVPIEIRWRPAADPAAPLETVRFAPGEIVRRVIRPANDPRQTSLSLSA